MILPRKSHVPGTEKVATREENLITLPETVIYSRCRAGFETELPDLLEAASSPIGTLSLFLLGFRETSATETRKFVLRGAVLLWYSYKTVYFYRYSTHLIYLVLY